MVLTSSRILSCGVWLILMRNTSAPASNSLRIIALSEEAGPSVARILIRRRRLIACFQALAAGPVRRPVDWEVPAGRDRPVRPYRECPARAATAARWLP